MNKIRITTHPGEILREEFLDPARAERSCVGGGDRRPAQPRDRHPRRAAIGDSRHRDQRLGRFFGTSSQFWLNLQQSHDLSKAERDGDFSKVRPRESAAVLEHRRRQAIADLRGLGWEGDLDAMRTDRD